MRPHEFLPLLRKVWRDPDQKAAALLGLIQNPGVTEFWIRTAPELMDEERPVILAGYLERLREYYVVPHEQLRDPTAVFGNSHPLRVEIGFGRGAHLLEQAAHAGD